MPVIWGKFGNKHLIEIKGADNGSSGGGADVAISDLINKGFQILEDRQRATERTPGRPPRWLVRLRDLYGQTPTTRNTLIIVSSGQRKAIEDQINGLIGNREHSLRVDLTNAAIFDVDNWRSRETYTVGIEGSASIKVDVSGHRREVVHLNPPNITRTMHVHWEGLKQLHPMAFRPTLQQLENASANLQPTSRNLEAYLKGKMRQNFMGNWYPVSFCDTATMSPGPQVSPAEQLRNAAIRARQEDENEES